MRAIAYGVVGDLYHRLPVAIAAVFGISGNLDRVTQRSAAQNIVSVLPGITPQQQQARRSLTHVDRDPFRPRLERAEATDLTGTQRSVDQGVRVSHALAGGYGSAGGDD